ncbi:metallophosphoesterase [Actinomyces vulturis]|uniref:metallophosphoesterase n=1 Tax=Actinomyces vulturis TaxID=1857645 RepID=UPI0008379C56|nr:metallophosphoesterase [Actinomyces vulturis]
MPSFPLARATGVLGLGAIAGLSWSVFEARWPVLRRYEVECLAPGSAAVTLLHLADLHLTGATEARVAWVRQLVDEQPDMVVLTGDNLSHADGVEAFSRAIEPFVGIPGAFVMGDHDYHETVFKSPTRYLRSDPRSADDPHQELGQLPWQEMIALQRSAGWVDLTNTRGCLSVNDQQLRLVGVDDPHADRDVFPPPSDECTGTVVGTLGLTHAPYRRVLAAMERDGCDLVLAGHTHGGQLCIPGFGALVTNCDIDTSRASGLSVWPGSMSDRHEALALIADEPRVLRPRSGEGPMWLHVSAGLGTSPFTPVRFACRPEASLITLLARD